MHIFLFFVHLANRLPAVKNNLSSVETVIGDDRKLAFLVNKFDKCMNQDNETWDNLDWVCQKW